MWNIKSQVISWKHHIKSTHAQHSFIYHTRRRRHAFPMMHIYREWRKEERKWIHHRIEVDDLFCFCWTKRAPLASIGSWGGSCNFLSSHQLSIHFLEFGPSSFFIRPMIIRNKMPAHLVSERYRDNKRERQTINGSLRNERSFVPSKYHL